MPRASGESAEARGRGAAGPEDGECREVVAFRQLDWHDLGAEAAQVIDDGCEPHRNLRVERCHRAVSTRRPPWRPQSCGGSRSSGGRRNGPCSQSCGSRPDMASSMAAAIVDAASHRAEMRYGAEGARGVGGHAAVARLQADEARERRRNPDGGRPHRCRGETRRLPWRPATAAPPEDPPGVMAGFHGLRVMPLSGPSVSAFQPNSGVVVRPRMVTPAARRRATGRCGPTCRALRRCSRFRNG